MLVVNVQPGSAAEKAGLRGTRQFGGQIVLGDIIKAIDGKPVRDYDELRTVLDDYKVGDVVELIVLRGEEVVTLSVTLEAVE